VRVHDDSSRQIAQSIVRAHDEHPALRAVVAEAAPRLHAILERDRRRRNVVRVLLAVTCTGGAFLVAVLVGHCAR